MGFERKREAAPELTCLFPHRQASHACLRGAATLAWQRTGTSRPAHSRNVESAETSTMAIRRQWQATSKETCVFGQSCSSLRECDDTSISRHACNLFSIQYRALRFKMTSSERVPQQENR
eukprot:5553467-Pleurochrysis_carterae.AAC.2